jgi:hypothetical protein
MRAPDRIRRGWRAAVGAGALALAVGCGGENSRQTPPASEGARLPGDSIVLGEGMVRSWVEIDPEGRPLALGVDLPDEVVASVPDGGVMMSLVFPEVEGLPFRHVLFDWSPEGHPPAELYHLPHWDAHFYTLTPEERGTIAEGPTTVRPPVEHMPEGFVPVPGLGLYAFPEMGVHWVAEEAGELLGRTFDHTLIYGSTGDRTIFVEPMFTQAFLATRPDLDAPVRQPAAVAEPGWYPTRYVIRRNARDTGFRIAIEGLRWREAVTD